MNTQMYYSCTQFYGTKTDSSGVCMCVCTCKMHKPATLFTFQRSLHPHLHFTVGCLPTRILGESEYFSLLSSTPQSNRSRDRDLACKCNPAAASSPCSAAAHLPG
jgi:hypothetical protein